MKIERSAFFSSDRKYRYVLYRGWDERPKIMCIGLNPSTANHIKDDNTIRRLIGLLSPHWGGFYMLNLFAMVTPYPEILFADKDPIGDNDKWLLEYSAKSERIIFCWGNFNVGERRETIEKMFGQAYCFGRNKNGSPKHPLYLPKNALMQEIYMNLYIYIRPDSVITGSTEEPPEKPDGKYFRSEEGVNAKLDEYKHHYESSQEWKDSCIEFEDQKMIKYRMALNHAEKNNLEIVMCIDDFDLIFSPDTIIGPIDLPVEKVEQMRPNHNFHWVNMDRPRDEHNIMEYRTVLRFKE